jgi:hypothetical protein
MAEPRNNPIGFLGGVQSRDDFSTPSIDPIIDLQSQTTSVDAQLDRATKAILHSLESKIQKNQPENHVVTRINFLPNKYLKFPIDYILERDDDSFLARTLEIPLYGVGEDAIEAVEALKYEIESLYDDLMEDDNFTGEWLRIKEYLKAIIVE